MAKVTGLHQSPRAPSMRRAVTFSPGPSGMVARAWPINGKRKLSPKQQEAVEAFREAALIAKYAPAADQMRSRELAHGSQFLPRDLQYMAIFGRLCTLFFNNGQRRYQLASRYDLTELLDILGFQPGTILFRGPEFWETLELGQEQQVLTVLDGQPRWANPGGGGGGAGFRGGMGPSGSVSRLTTGYATRLVSAIVQEDIHVNELSFAISGQVSNSTHIYQIVEFGEDGPSGGVKSIIAQTPTFARQGNVDRRYFQTFPIPIDLQAGQRIGLAVSQNSHSATVPCNIASTGITTGTWALDAPVEIEPTVYSYQSNALTIDQEPDHTASAWVPVALGGGMGPFQG